MNKTVKQCFQDQPKTRGILVSHQEHTEFLAVVENFISEEQKEALTHTSRNVKEVFGCLGRRLKFKNILEMSIEKKKVSI